MLAAKAHYVFDTGSVIPTAVEDHDLPGSRKMMHIALDVHLALFAIGGSRQRHLTKNPGTYSFRDCSNRAAFTCAISPLKHNNDAETFIPYPGLKFAKLRLEVAQLRFKRLAVHILLSILVLLRHLHHYLYRRWYRGPPPHPLTALLQSWFHAASRYHIYSSGNACKSLPRGQLEKLKEGRSEAFRQLRAIDRKLTDLSKRLEALWNLLNWVAALLDTEARD